MRFRQGVYANRGNISAGCQVLLLRLSDDMNDKCIVSIPRSRLAEELDCPPARITEWISQAKGAGFLQVVRRARPKVTAVYAGMFVDSEVRPAVPHQRYGNPFPSEVRERVPLTGPQRYAQHLPQEVVGTEALGETPADHVERRGIDEKSGGSNVVPLAERRA